MAKFVAHSSKTFVKREALTLTENARFVLANRYLRKGPDGKTAETPEQLFDRVALHVARIEKNFGSDEAAVQLWQDHFYNLMASLKFLPNSPTLMNAGLAMGMLSACFVLPVPDSIDGIFDTVKHTAMIQKAGGGTGFSFDLLRPTGDYIASSGGRTSGPISFWRVLSETTNAIQQGAFRRGANMGMMSVTHPDILKFLHAKRDLAAFTNYNISVKITDEWMAQLDAQPHAPHIVQNPRTGKKYYLPRSLNIWQYNINDLVPTDPSQSHPAPLESFEIPGPFWSLAQLWQLIVTGAHATGEPGVAFIDRINRDNPTPNLGPIEATNPCGEQPLLPYEACNLGSINLAKFVQPVQTEEGALIAAAAEVRELSRIDFADLRSTVHLAVRFLDNVIDANNYQIEPIDRLCKANRKIGLGVMGFADALYKLAVPYDSESALAVGRELMRFINDEAHLASERLAKDRGVFENWPGSIWDTQYHRPQRNATVTTVAPTGTLSIIADCSGGIEPMFAVVFERNVLSGSHLLEVNSSFQEMARQGGFYSDNLIRRIARRGSLAALAEIPEDIKRIFVCAHDIAPPWHVRMQAAFQEHCDASISKTINFPRSATVEQVDEIYHLAFKLGCKGVTVYRDGCRQAQPMSHTKSGAADESTSEAAGGAGSSTSETAESAGEDAPPPKGLAQKPVQPITLPEIMTCVRVRQMTPFGNMHVKITVDPKTERELEVFAQLGKGGDIANSDLEAICRLLSLLLRCGGSFEQAIKQLDGIGSSLTIPARGGRIMSLGDGLAKAMAKYLAAKKKFGLKALLLGEVNEVNINILLKYDTITDECKDQDPVSDSSGANIGAAKEGPAAGFKVKCPSCNGVLSFEEGCVKCYKCGFSQC